MKIRRNGHARGSLRAGAILAGASLVLGLVGAGVSAASTGRPQPTLLSPQRFSVVPVAGDHFVEPGTSLSFLGVTRSDLAGLTVRGSKSGVHKGRLTALIGAKGLSFQPWKAFRPGETVTVTAPHLRMPGGAGDAYSFSVAHPASNAQARKAFAIAAKTDGLGGAPQRSRGKQPPTCSTVSYKSEPNLDAQSACMNTGVTTSGTPAGNLLMLTPGGAAGDGEGVYQPNGQLVWWEAPPGHGTSDHDLIVVWYGGNRYLGVWSGTGIAGYGNGGVYLWDEHYHPVGLITPSGFPSNWVDLHEFQITPQGDALIGIFDPVQEKIGSNTETVLQYVVQKLSLVKTGNQIRTGSLLFQWDSLVQVPVSNSEEPDPGNNGTWDYFHGNAITQDSDGNLVVSSRNTWGIYKIDDTPGSASFGHLLWQVGAAAAGDNTISEPWCYQHDIVAMGNQQYSLYDDGGVGPNCAFGSTQHASRGLIISITPSASAAGGATVSLVHAYTHTPPIYSGFTGSTERLRNGDVLVSWAENPEITEYNAAGTVVKMDLTLSDWSYRGVSQPWVGIPTWKPDAAASVSGGKTDVWMSWNGSTEVAKWIVLAGPSASHLTPIHRYWARTNFESTAVLGNVYPWVAVEAVSSNGTILARSAPTSVAGG